jgi:hypothetical protein
MPTGKRRPRGPSRGPKMQWAAIRAALFPEVWESGPYRIYHHRLSGPYTLTLDMGAGLEMVLERGVPDLKSAKLKARIHARGRALAGGE